MTQKGNPKVSLSGFTQPGQAICLLRVSSSFVSQPSFLCAHSVSYSWNVTLSPSQALPNPDLTQIFPSYVPSRFHPLLPIKDILTSLGAKSHRQVFWLRTRVHLSDPWHLYWQNGEGRDKIMVATGACPKWFSNTASMELSSGAWIGESLGEDFWEIVWERACGRGHVGGGM